MQTAVGEFLVNYEVLGEKSAPPLIILHGWGRNFQDWIPAARFLSSKYKVVLVDLPGFGGTNLPSNTVMGTYDYADFVEKFLEKIEIRKPTLLGHSFGGRLGIVLASKKSFLSKLILVDSAGIEQKSLKVILIGLFYKILKFLLPKRLNELVRARLGSEDYASAGPLRKVLVKVVNEDLTQHLSQIKVPTLVIWGDKDINQYVKYGKIMRDKIPEARLRIVWEAGHNPHVEDSKQFFQILKEEIL